MSGHVRDMQAAGELPDWVDADAMPSVLIALANGLVLQVTIDPDGPDLPTMARQVAGLLLAARRTW